MIVRLGIMTLHRCQAVALDSSRLNPSIRLLIAVKLMDVILTPLAQCRDTAFPLEEGSATVVNKLPFFSLICDHCDIFAASHNSGLQASQTSGLVSKAGHRLMKSVVQMPFAAWSSLD